MSEGDQCNELDKTGRERIDAMQSRGCCNFK